MSGGEREMVFGLGKAGETRIKFCGDRLPRRWGQGASQFRPWLPGSKPRYFPADIYPGGSREFQVAASESAHGLGCQEAVARYDAGIKITNRNEFERKKVGGATLITRNGRDHRISGLQLKLSTD